MVDDGGGRGCLWWVALISAAFLFLGVLVGFFAIGDDGKSRPPPVARERTAEARCSEGFKMTVEQEGTAFDIGSATLLVAIDRLTTPSDSSRSASEAPRS